MTFACLGWVSLIWDETRAAELPMRGGWHVDGPSLPIEFARISSDQRVTLVVTPGAKRVPVLWSVLDVGSMEEAIARLAQREGPKGGKPTPERNIGRHPGGDDCPELAEIASWRSTHGFDGVVWTALKPNFETCPPLLSDVLWHLTNLSGTAAINAKDYIRNAPGQIETEFRVAIMAAIGG